MASELKQAIYHHYDNNNFDDAEKYYIIAADKGEIIAMHNLAAYYHLKTKEFEKCKKYYKMAIDKGYYPSMGNFANYYEYEKKNFDEAEKYHLMALEHDPDNDKIVSMMALGQLYEKMERYCDAIELFEIVKGKETDYCGLIHVNDCLRRTKKIRDNGL